MADDQLDIEQPDALLAYLRETGRVGADETPRIKTLAGGVSNRTVLVERPGGEAWVLKQALPKLRVAVDWFSDPARIRREAEAIRWLPQVTPPGTIMPLVFEDPSHHLLAMEAVPRPHWNFKDKILTNLGFPCEFESFGKVLGQIHRRSWERRDEFSRLFDDRTFFESLRVEPYYEYTAAQVPEAAAFLRQLVADTRSRRFALVHGDYSPKNVLLRPGRQLILLDHEVIHWGDPAFDVGFALTHLLAKARHMRDWDSASSTYPDFFLFGYAKEVYDKLPPAVYVTRDRVARPAPWADDVMRMAVRHTLGCMLARLAGRSRLEYLRPDDRGWLRARTLELMRSPPEFALELAQRFCQP